MRVCIFVDGENFRRNIGQLFPHDFNRNEYLPKQARWAEFFDWLCEEVCGEDAQRLRTYWYVIEQVDYNPYKIPRVNREPDTLHKVLCKHEPFKQELDGLVGNNRTAKMSEMAEQLKDAQQRFGSRFNGWRVI